MIMSEKILEVKHLGKAFGSNQVLRDIDFQCFEHSHELVLVSGECLGYRHAVAYV